MTGVLVTGGAGFIGSHLVDYLVAEDYQVTVLDDFSSGKRSNLADAEASGAIRIVTGSILDQKILAEAMGGCSAVFHMAVQCVRRSIGKPLENHERNATGTLMVLESARREGVERFVYCSSSEVYGNASEGLLSEKQTVCSPITVYGAAKLVGEYYAQAYRHTYGLPTVIVRPFNAFGPREHDQGDLAEVIPRFVIRALNGLPPVIFGSGEQGRDFTYVSDIARGLFLAGNRDAMVGKTVNLGHGRLITVREVAQTIIQHCGRNNLSIEYMAPRPGDTYRLVADTKHAESLLDFEPEVTFDEGVARYVSWVREIYPDISGLLESEVINWTLPGH
jgi:UDP-glucose 4-epimerase